MDTALAYLFLAAILVAPIAYHLMLRKGIRPRAIVTSLDDAAVRALFVRHVAGSGWKIVEDGEPMVAESPLVTGIRQRIQLQLGEDSRYPGRTTVRVTVTRYARKALRGTPTKAHTLRIRMNAFVNAVTNADPSAVNLENAATAPVVPAGTAAGPPGPVTGSMEAPQAGVAITAYGGAAALTPAPLTPATPVAPELSVSRSQPTSPAIPVAAPTARACGRCGVLCPSHLAACPACGSPV